MTRLRSRHCRAAVGCLVILLAAGLRADGRQQPAPQTPPRFQSGIEVVALDVTVVDKKGTPVAGLAPAGVST